jgi:hypothetical protein
MAQEENPELQRDYQLVLDEPYWCQEESFLPRGPFEVGKFAEVRD